MLIRSVQNHGRLMIFGKVKILQIQLSHVKVSQEMKVDDIRHA